jgi:hypothetical protein
MARKAFAIVAPEFATVHKGYKIKIVESFLETVEPIAFVANIYNIAVWAFNFKFAGERQERGYVAAGPAPR